MRRELKVLPNADLTRRNTLRFPSRVDELVVLDDVRDVAAAFDYEGPLSILGDGSNSILMPNIRGRVVRLALRGIHVEEQDDGSYLVKVAAGENWHEVVRYTLGRGIAGLENLALIPGSVGAAPYQNIGAYGVELDEFLVSVVVFDRKLRQVLELDNDACQFGYRDSVFKQDQTGRYVVLNMLIRLGSFQPNTEYPDLRRRLKMCRTKTMHAVNIAENVIQIRKEKLPDLKSYPNVGSVFKNPIVDPNHASELKQKIGVPCYQTPSGVKISAAYLIDSAGWKGRICEGILIWPRQPLVFVHSSGSANALDFLNVARSVQEDVSARFAVNLELEPVVVGE